jgi:hypothetical protein
MPGTPAIDYGGGRMQYGVDREWHPIVAPPDDVKTRTQQPPLSEKQFGLEEVALITPIPIASGRWNG